MGERVPELQDSNLNAPSLRAQRLPFGIVLAAGFMTLLDVSIVNVALPAIEKDLKAGPQEIQLIVAGYALTFGLTLVAAGRAGDMFGRRRLFLIGLAGFVLASAGCGFASDDTVLAIMRLIQGLFAGVLNPQILGVMQDLFSGPTRARAFGIYGIAVGISSAIGPAVGGALVSGIPGTWGWRSVFLINLPIGLIVLPLAARILPHATTSTGAPKDVARQFDLPGVLLVGASVVTLMVPFLAASGENSGGADGGDSPNLFWLLGVALILMFLTWRWERRAHRQGRPVLLDPRLIHNPSFMFGVATSLFYFAGFTSIFIVITMYLQQGHHWSAWSAGLAVVPFALVSGALSGLSGRLVNRFGRAVPIVGATVFVCALLAMAACSLWLPKSHQPAGVIVAMAVAGAGSGLLISPNQALTLESVPHEAAGVSSALLQTFQRLGTAVGLAVVTTIFFRGVSGIAGNQGYGWALALAATMIAGFATLALISSVADALRRRRQPPSLLPEELS